MAVPNLSSARLLQLQKSELSYMLPPIINEQSLPSRFKLSKLNLEIEDTLTIQFPNLISLQNAVRGPLPIDEKVAVKVIARLQQSFEINTYYAHELAFLLAEFAIKEKGLTQEEITQNMGYLLSNLASGNNRLLERLCTCYYALSFLYAASQ